MRARAPSLAAPDRQATARLGAEDERAKPAEGRASAKLIVGNQLFESID